MVAITRPTPSAPAPHAQERRRDVRIFLLLAWGAAVLSLAGAFGLNSESTDDAMRLVEVRDWLAGQGWFDLTQYRLDPPHGVAMHWSRLIDLPLALLIRGGALFANQSLAEAVALALWPTALLLAFLAGVARLARALAGDTAACIALLFAVLMAPVLQHFRTGAIDHHNVQLTLAIWSLALFAGTPARARDAAIAGGLCALSVAIGAEMVPAVAVLALIVAARWVIGGALYRAATIGFATTLATGALVLAVATIAPAKYFSVDCDANSIAQVAALALGGFGLAGLASVARLNTIALRLGATGALAALLAAALAAGARQCFADPYGRLDPRLVDLWIATVSEGRNIFSLLRDLPEQVPVYFGPPLAALVLGVMCCWREREDRRWGWIACTATEAILLIATAWELRFAAGVNAVAAVLLPAGLIRLMPAVEGRPSYFGVTRAAWLVMLVLNPVVLLAFGSGAARAFEPAVPAANRLVRSDAAGACHRPADYAPLGALPRGRVLAFIDAGPLILMQSPHSVFAAPYHRNETGNLAMLDTFMATPEAAKALLAANQVSYVAFCPGAPERFTYAQAAPHSLVAALAENRPPAYLEPIPLSGTDLIVYRVVR